MEFKKAPTNDPHECIITFDGPGEAELIRSIYKERVAGFAAKASTGLITRRELFLSQYGEDDSFPEVSFLKTAQIVEAIRDFHIGTDSALIELVEESGTPRFKNEYIAERIQLGKKALELAEEIEKRADQAENADKSQLKEEVQGLEAIPTMADHERRKHPGA